MTLLVRMTFSLRASKIDFNWGLVYPSGQNGTVFLRSAPKVTTNLVVHRRAAERTEKKWLSPSVLPRRGTGAVCGENCKDGRSEKLSDRT